MDPGLLSIGKMAQMNNLTVATLRLYDRLGLLHPWYTDEATGYRYYDIRQNARLDMIAYMKELGMSLAEIGDILAREDITLIEDVLLRKHEQIHRQIRDLKIQHDMVERAIAGIERRRKSPTTGTISLEYIDRRFIWAVPCTENFYETGISGYEKMLAGLRAELLRQGFTHIYSYNVGTSIARADFLAGRLVPEKLFVFLDHRVAAGRADAAAVDSGMYACIYLERFADEADCAGRLLEFCREQQYDVCGDYLCEVMTEANIFDSDDRRMYLRLQVPVRFR